jgi:TonB family protein
MTGKGLVGIIILYSFVYSYNTHQHMTKSIVFTLLLIALFTPVLSAQTDSVVPKLSDSVVYIFVDTSSSFPGGDQALMKYLASNTEYPAKAREMGHEGIVYVGFVVEADGSLTNIRIIKGAFPTLDSAAVAVVRGMPLWIPGKQDGRNVRSEFVLPMHFQLYRNPPRSERNAARRRR